MSESSVSVLWDIMIALVLPSKWRHANKFKQWIAEKHSGYCTVRWYGTVQNMCRRPDLVSSGWLQKVLCCPWLAHMSNKVRNSELSASFWVLDTESRDSYIHLKVERDRKTRQGGIEVVVTVLLEIYILVAANVLSRKRKEVEPSHSWNEARLILFYLAQGETVVRWSWRGIQAW